MSQPPHPVIALAGRPNVGKSTLFNRLAGRQKAIISPVSGTTRDWQESPGRIGPLEVRLLDTAGLEENAERGSISERMTQMTTRALGEADVILFVIDAANGLTPEDEHWARALRKTGKKVVLVANKCDASRAATEDAYRLGFGEPVALSAAHGLGLAELYQEVVAQLGGDETESPAPKKRKRNAEDAQEEGPEKPVPFVVMGRPNVGKSTLVNHWLGEERMLTGPEAGITRDAVRHAFTFQGRALELVDTAGLRRKSKIQESLEEASVDSTLNALRFAEVAILVIDALQPLEKQDVTLGALAEREGRAMVLALNKWDQIKNPQALLHKLHERLKDVMPQCDGIPVIPVSAATGYRTDALLEAALAQHAVWNKRIPTAALNRWLEEVTSRHTPPLIRGRRLKIRYITQIRTRPPTFALSVNQSKEFPEDYRRYLVHQLRAAFDMPGVPVRMRLKKSANPYAEDA